MQAIRRKRFSSYWVETSAIESLMRYISLDYMGLSKTIAELVGGNHVSVNPIAFSNDLVTFRDRDDVLTLLIHLGYLAYNEEEGKAYIPNEETTPLFYNNEHALRSVVKLAYFAYRDYYLKFVELPAGAGFADIVYFPKKDTSLPALLIELKWNKSARGAIEQIKDKKYPGALKDYGGEVLLVGINYEKDAPAGERKHTCVIEKMKFD